MTQEDPNALARLLGVSADLEPERLRAAYELAMNRATRAGDHSRALALSRAFDALPDGTRSSVYSGTRTYASVLTPEPRRERTPRRRRGGGVGSRTSRPPRRRRRVSWKGVLIYGILIPGIVVLAGWGLYRQNNPDYDDYTPPPEDRSPAVVQPPPGPSLFVPADARVASNGRASVLCQVSAGRAGLVITARPGTSVTCPNRATPRLIAP